MKNCQEINLTYDLKSLLERDTLLKPSGRWYIGPCPFCGGKDRFNLKQSDRGWVWYCRGCGDGKYHTAIDYVMKKENLSLPAALRAMTPGAARLPLPSSAPPCPPPVAPQKNLSLHFDLWSARANRFVDACMYELWFGKDLCRNYLLQKRLLAPDNLVANFVGYHPLETFEDARLWGFTDRSKVWLPAGIVFPCFDENMRLWSIKIRQFEKTPKYVKLAGSKSGVFGYRNLRGARIIGVTEGEIDCLTLEQEAGDMLGACTLGSAMDNFKNLDFARWGSYFIQSQAILLFFDNDEAGQKGARRMQVNRTIHVVGAMPGYKDLNEMLLAGQDIGAWVCQKIASLSLL